MIGWERENVKDTGATKARQHTTRCRFTTRTHDSILAVLNQVVTRPEEASFQSVTPAMAVRGRNEPPNSRPFSGTVAVNVCLFAGAK
jgi:hypothetical protein